MSFSFWRITAVQRVEQVSYARGAPNVTTLHLRQAQFASFDHSNKFPHIGVDFTHGKSLALQWWFLMSCSSPIAMRIDCPPALFTF